MKILITAILVASSTTELSADLTPADVAKAIRSGSYAPRQVGRGKWLVEGGGPVRVWKRDHPARYQPSIRQSKPTFKVPNGKFGLILKDGTKMIGVPSKTWSATIEARFGVVTIPREQIASIEVQNGVARIHLTNGDRVSGKLKSATVKFETAYGVLNVSAGDLVRMGTGRMNTENMGTSNSAPAIVKPKPPVPSRSPKVIIRSTVEPDVDARSPIKTPEPFDR